MGHGPARPGVKSPHVREFRITSIDSNSVYGYAISGMYADMNDSNLRRGQVTRLVPWT